MRLKWLIAAAIAAFALGAGTAIATHVPQVDPTTVPEGFLATHNDVATFRISSFARAVKKHRADVFVQHVRLGPNGATPWHTHPGAAIVTVVSGSLGYQDQHGKRCRTVIYQQGHGFVDQGFGHIHRAVAGPAGAHFYVTYILPSGSTNHIILGSPPKACS